MNPVQPDQILALVSFNILMALLLLNVYFFAKSHQFDIYIYILTTLALLNWFLCTNIIMIMPKLCNINHVIGMVNVFQAKYDYIFIKIFHE